MLADFLTITTAVIRAISETNDGMGGKIETSSQTVLPRCIIFQNGSNPRWLNDRVNKNSTHTLVCEPSAHSWGIDDREILYNGSTYKIAGKPDNILWMDEIIVVPLSLLE